MSNTQRPEEKEAKEAKETKETQETKEEVTPSLWSAETTSAWEPVGDNMLQFMRVLNEFFQTEQTFYENIKFITAYMEKISFKPEDGIYYSSVLSDLKGMIALNPFYKNENTVNIDNQKIGLVIGALTKLLSEYNIFEEVRKVKKLTQELDELNGSSDQDNKEKIQKTAEELNNAKTALAQNEMISKKAQEIKALEKEISAPVKRLYDVLVAAYTGDSNNPSPMQVFANNANNFINKYDTTQSFLTSLTANDAAFAQIQQEFKNKPEAAGKDFASYHIMPVQRFPRYMLLSKELIKRSTQNSPEAMKLQSITNQATEIGNVMNKSRTTTPSKMISYVIVSHLANQMEKNNVAQLTQTPNDSQMQLNASRISAMQNVLKKMTLPDAGAVEQEITRIKNLAISLAAKAVYVAELTKHEQMLYHVLEQIDKRPDDLGLIEIRDKLKDLIAQEAKYKNILTILEVLKELDQIDGVPDLVRIKNRIDLEREEVSKAMDSAQENLNKAIDSVDINKSFSTDAMTHADQSSRATLTSTRANVTSTILPPRPTPTTTTLPPRPSVVSTNMQKEINAEMGQASSLTDVTKSKRTIDDEYKRATQYADLKRTKKNPVVELFKNKDHLANYKEKVKAEAPKLVSEARKISLSYALQETFEKIDENKKQLKEHKDTIESEMKSPVAVKSASLAILSSRTDEVGRYAKKWSGSFDENMRSMIRQHTQTLNDIVALQNKKVKLIQLLLRLEEYEKKTNELYKSIRDPSLRANFGSDQREEIATRVQEFLDTDYKDIHNLQSQIRNKMKELDNEISKQYQVMQAQDAQLTRTLAVNVETTRIKELKEKVQANNAEFLSLQGGLQQKLNYKAQTNSSLDELSMRTNYIGLVAKKWQTQQQVSNLKPIIEKLTTSLNSLEAKRNELNDLKTFEEQLQKYHSSKQMLQETREVYNESFAKENRNALSEISKIFVDKSESELEKMQNAINTRKQLLVGEIKLETRNLNIHEQQLNDIHRKNAIRSEVPSAKQASQFMEVMRFEYGQLRQKLEYLINTKQLKGNDLDIAKDTLVRLITNEARFNAATKPRELSDIMAANKFHENPFARNIAQGIDQGIEKLNDNAKNARKNNANKIADLKVIVKKPRNQTKPEEYRERLDATKNFCAVMIALLQERNDFLTGQALKDNQKLIEIYGRIQNTTKQYYEKFYNQKGLYRYDKDAQKALTDLLRSEDMKHVNSDLIANLKKVYEGVNQQIEIRNQSVKVSEKMNLSSNAAKRSELIRGTISNQNARRGFFGHDDLGPTKPPKPPRFRPGGSRGGNT